MKIIIEKFLIKCDNQMIKHIKRMLCHIPNLVQAFRYVEHGGLNLCI